MQPSIQCQHYGDETFRIEPSFSESRSVQPCLRQHFRAASFWSAFRVKPPSILEANFGLCASQDFIHAQDPAGSAAPCAAKQGQSRVQAFGDYAPDPNSVFMTLVLGG